MAMLCLETVAAKLFPTDRAMATKAISNGNLENFILLSLLPLWNSQEIATLSPPELRTGANNLRFRASVGT